MKRRRLEDLYVLGRELALDDGKGEPVVVWIQKMNPLEHEKALRKAGAAKAKILMVRHDRDSEDWQEAYTDVEDTGGRAELVEYLITEDVGKAEESAEAELSFADEWSKDNYLQGLRDAWDDPDHPLREVYAENPEDPEASRVFLELKRFSDQVIARVAPEAERLRRDYEEVPEETVRERATEHLIELRAGLAWIREYRRCEVWLGTRDPDNHDAYYFPNRDAVDRLSYDTFRELSDAYQQLTVEPLEGKGSPEIPSSSPPSEPSGEAETSGPSGLQVVAR
jgi:hypothetical protein